MRSEVILALDPSGAYHEGKGTTGYCVMTKCNTILEAGTISAACFESMEAYWAEHLYLLEHVANNTESLMVVIEDYLLYESRALSQTNSRMETPKLIGVLQYNCWAEEQPYCMQTAGEVKARWADHILVHKGILELRQGKYYVPHETEALSGHTRDAIRHAVHYNTFRNKGE